MDEIEYDNKKLNDMSDAELAEYWDNADVSDLLEKGEHEVVEAKQIKRNCQFCKSSRLRRRFIDLPILDRQLVFKKISTLYCADCGRSVIEKPSFDMLVEKLSRVGLHPEPKSLLKVLAKALQDYEQHWSDLENERKVISIYFTKKGNGHKKAQISLRASDPLYPKLRALASEDIRGLLGVDYYDDLKLKANESKRTLSEYMRLLLADKLLNFTQPQAEKSDKKALVLEFKPKQVPRDYFGQAEELPTLAAEGPSDMLTVIETPNKDFGAVLAYDYSTASLFLEVKRNDFCISSFDADLFLSGGKHLVCSQVRLENNKARLLEKTDDITDRIDRVKLEGVSCYEQ